jgi:CubicO group peptidase (beta-lactamase class C family)
MFQRAKTRYHWTGVSGVQFWVDPASDMYAVMLVQAARTRGLIRPSFRNLVYAALEK